MDSLLESPQPVNWDIGDDEPMGPQIPDVPLEDIKMSAVDLGDKSPKLTALTPPQIESSPIIPIRSPTPVAPFILHHELNMSHSYLRTILSRLAGAHVEEMIVSTVISDLGPLLPHRGEEIRIVLAHLTTIVNMIDVLTIK